MEPKALPFAAQRIVYFALLMSMVVYSIVPAVVLQQNGGKGLAETPLASLDTTAIALGALLAVAAVVVRSKLHAKAAQQRGAQRTNALFRATLVPLAMLEAGCLMSLTAWLLNGNPVPGLVVAMVLLSLAILIVPMRDPDEA
jgi:hypothetical protein